MRKSMFAVCLLTVLLLSSCKQYLAFEFNRYTRVYLPGISTNSDMDAFDLYRDNGNQVFRAGDRIYIFDTPQSTYGGRHCPSLAYVTEGDTELHYLCQNAACVHNEPVWFTERCILCDLSDYRSVVYLDGKIYFLRADRSDGKGGFYFDQTDGTDYSETETLYFATMDTTLSGHDTEVPWELIAYDLESGEYEVLYTVSAGCYLEDIVYDNGKLFFVETYYAERKHLVFTHSDGDWFYFYNTKTDLVETRRERWFYTALTVRAEKDRYYMTLPEEERPAGSGGYLINPRDHRKYLVGEQDQLWEKVYGLVSYDLKMKEASLVIPELPSEPTELLAYDGRLYIADREELRSMSTSDPTDCYRLVSFAGQSWDGRELSLMQYDEYGDSLYFLCQGTIYRVVIYEDRGIINAMPCFAGIVTGFQATISGIYVTAGWREETVYDPTLQDMVTMMTDYRGSLYFFRWNELRDGREVCIIKKDSEFFLSYGTVVGNAVYVATKEIGEHDAYRLYRVQMKTEVLSYESADADTPGAGITEYRVLTESVPLTRADP